MEQSVLIGNTKFSLLDRYLIERGEESVFVVCGSHVLHDEILGPYISSMKARIGLQPVIFSDVTPNPLYSIVKKASFEFAHSGCQTILAIGGGSAIDVAKCIKLFWKMDSKELFFYQTPIPNAISLVAIPTTAGSGSEATKYAVIYYNGQKQSISDDSIIPEVVLHEPALLDSLSAYQKKCTIMDTLCHAIEAYWSINSTEESRHFSIETIGLFLDNYKLYLLGDSDVNDRMLRASYFGGKAINIAQTTAGHALSYQLTEMLHIAHGHAVALADCVLWPWLLHNLDKCKDSRGADYLWHVFCELAEAFGGSGVEDGPIVFKRIFSELDLPTPRVVNDDELQMLVASVNPVRLKNSPVNIDSDAIRFLYRNIFYEGSK